MTDQIPARVHVCDPRPITEFCWKAYLTDDSAGKREHGAILGTVVGNSEALCLELANLLAQAPRLREME